MSQTVIPDERLLRDAFAEVYAPEHGGLFKLARVFITNHRVLVYVERDDRQIRKVLEETITGELPEADRSTLQGQLRIDAAAGPVHVSKSGGCGCHSTLKALGTPVTW